MILKPALRLINNLSVGTLSGTVSSELLNEACENVTENDGAVYVYSGTVEAATDISGAEADPLTTALVDDSDGWTYQLGYLAVGDYTAAYTCDNDLDDPEVDNNGDAVVDNDVMFYQLTPFNIAADATTVVDFDLSP